MIHDKKAPLFHRRADLAARRFNRYGIHLFERLYTYETGRAIPNICDDTALSKAVFFKNVEGWLANRSSALFYDASAHLFRRYAPAAFSHMKLGSNPLESFTSTFQRDSLLLLQQHNTFAGTDDFDYGNRAASLQRFFHLFQQSRNAILGENISDTSIGAATIRLSIEARLKQAVGIFDVRNNTTGRVTSVKMSNIFLVLARRKQDYKIAVSLDIIKTIYNWSNNYIHSGMLSPAWLNFYAHELMDPMFVPNSLNEGVNWDFGLVMSKTVLISIKNEICAEEGKNYSTFFGTPPEGCIVGLV